MKEARITIENPESSQEQVDAAKAKIEEIKALLEEEYNLNIKSDNSDLDNAVEQVKKLTGNDLRQAIADEQMQLANLAENYRNAMTRLPEMQAKFDNANERLSQFKELNSELRALGAEYRRMLPLKKQGKLWGLPLSNRKIMNMFSDGSARE